MSDSVNVMFLQMENAHLRDIVTKTVAWLDRFAEEIPPFPYEELRSILDVPSQPEGDGDGD